MKVWNPRRVAKMRERKRQAREKDIVRSIAEYEHRRSYTKGDTKKNARLMLDALALPLRRQMIARLAREGSMPLSKLAAPFRLVLSTAQFHLGILERAGIVDTYKAGRHRFVTFNKKSFADLATFLTSSPKDLS